MPNNLCGRPSGDGRQGGLDSRHWGHGCPHHVPQHPPPMAGAPVLEAAETRCEARCVPSQFTAPDSADFLLPDE